MKHIKTFSILSILGIVNIAPLVIVSCSYQNNENKPVIPTPPLENNNTQDSDQFLNHPNSFSTPIKLNDSIKLKLPNNMPTGTKPEQGYQTNPKLKTNQTPFEQIIKNVKRSFHLGLRNKDGSIAVSGTAWILDYELVNDNSYPTTWYFASNVHVLDSLNIRNEKLKQYQRWDDNENNLTEKISLYTIDRKLLNTTNEYGDSMGVKWEKYGIGIKNNDAIQNSMIDDMADVNTVFLATDFLKTKPSDFSDDIRWKNLEEYADFGVIQIKFDNPEIARKVTANYANTPENHIKIPNQSLMAEKNLDDKRLIVAGFPTSDGSRIDLTINTPINIEQKQAGQLLTRTPWYNSFKSYRGLHDAAITIPLLCGGGAISFGKFVNWGLLYSINYSNLSGGSSGSMVTDNNNNVVGIHFACDDDASIDFVQALHSDGFNYHNYYGDYNLPGYDLVYGGFDLQKSSYYDCLKILYANNNSIRTNLFKNGLFN